MIETFKQSIKNKVLSQKSLVTSLTFSALFLFVPAFYYPLIKIDKLSRIEEASLFHLLIRLFENSPLLFLVVLFTTVVTPVVMIYCLFAFSLSEKTTYSTSGFYKAYRFVRDWMMLDVFALGVVASKIKLDSIVQAHVEVGVVFCLILWLLIFLADFFLWFEIKRKSVSYSVHKTVAISTGAIFLFIAANVLPVVSRTKLGVVYNLTLWDSVSSFFNSETWGLGILVFVTTYISPLFKIFFLFYVCMTLKSLQFFKLKKLTHDVMEYTNRWSMLNIFITTSLVGIVKLGSLASVESEVGSILFSGVVILIIIATSSLTLKEPKEVNET